MKIWLGYEQTEDEQPSNYIAFQFEVNATTWKEETPNRNIVLIDLKDRS